MCLPALAALPAILGAASGAAATAAGAGTFLGVAASTWSTIGLVSSIGGTLLQGIGAIQQGQSQKAAYEANAKTQRYQALDAERRGSIEEGQQRERVNLALGSQNARQGASGVVAGQDTGSDVLAESADYGARDAATIRVNALRDAWGLRTQAQNDQFQGRQAASAGIARGGATFMQGFSNLLAPAPWWQRYRDEQDNLDRSDAPRMGSY